MTNRTDTAATIKLNDCLVVRGECLDVIVEPSVWGTVAYVDVVSRTDGEPASLRFLVSDRVERLA